MKNSILKLFYTFLLVFSSLLPIQAMAAEEAQNLPNAPKALGDRTTPIAIEHEGSDSLGSLLALKLKERINTSSLFTLEQKDKPKFRILISTVSEFEERPQVGSAYAVVWVFSQSEANLRHFIFREVGVVNQEDIEAVTTKILEKTDGLAVRYSYLFPEDSE